MGHSGHAGHIVFFVFFLGHRVTLVTWVTLCFLVNFVSGSQGHLVLFGYILLLGHRSKGLSCVFFW